MQFWIARCIFLSFRRFIHRTLIPSILLLTIFKKYLKYKYKISRKNPRMYHQYIRGFVHCATMKIFLVFLPIGIIAYAFFYCKMHFNPILTDFEFISTSRNSLMNVFLKDSTYWEFGRLGRRFPDNTVYIGVGIGNTTLEAKSRAV